MAENITLANLANLQNEVTAVNAINNNNSVITTAFVDVLSRSGVSPNTMGSPLDMNNWPIMNLPAPGSANSPARLVDVTSTNPITISLSLTGDITAPASSGVLTTTINKTPTSANLLIANGTTWNSTALSGDAAITNAGVLTVGNNAITTAKINTNAVDNTKIRQSAGLSVVGNTTNATSNVADITGTTRQVLAVNTAGTGLVFAQPRGDQLLGSATNDSATAGNVGEYVSSTIASGGAISLTTATPANITSISLTAGDWDVWINGYFVAAATTNITNLQVSLSTTSATLNTTPGQWGVWTQAAAVPNGTIGLNTGPVRFSFSGTNTVFFVAQGTFTVSTLTGYGIIQARRVR